MRTITEGAPIEKMEAPEQFKVEVLDVDETEPNEITENFPEDSVDEGSMIEPIHESEQPPDTPI